MEKECKEVAEKYRIEVMEKRKVEEKYDALVEKYRDVMMEILKEHCEIHGRHRFEQQEKLKLKRECEELKEKIELLRRAQESEKGEENVMFDKKYGVLQEKYEFERLENLKIRNEFKEPMKFHQLELIAKIKAENDLKECQARLEGLQEEVIVASERYDKLLKEVRKGRKAEDKMLVFECQNNNVDSQNRMCKETFELQASGSGKWMNAKSLDSRNKEKSSENGGIADERSDKNPRESFDHVIDLEDIPNSLPASEVSPQNGGLQTTDALKFSSGCSIIISDSDDDCAPGGKKQMGHKRKRDSSSNDNLEKDASSIKTAEMKQRKLGRCDSMVNYFSETVAPSAASDYGKQNKSSSHTHIISGAIEKVRGTQQSCVESPAMASKTPFDCESDDDSTSISSSDDSGCR
ncbi:hypothetical protein ACLB2K_048896 [Fragaria x ananassa]